MHVLVATDGHLDSELAAKMAHSLADDGPISVLTVVEIPRRFLTTMREAHMQTDVLMLDHEDVSVRASDVREHSSWPGDDAVIARYLDNQREQRTSELVAALEARGHHPTVLARESDDTTAKTIIDTINEIEADVVCIGSHGAGVFDGLLGSTGTKLARLSPCPVLLLRGD